MNKVKPKKALGQHFLTDETIAARIAATLDDYKGMPVLEVGPGMGVLTKYLLDYGHDVTAVEIDEESVDYLNHNFPSLHGRILGDDFLKMNLVAERLAAAPGSKVYGILSVLLQAWYDVEYLFTVNENVFNPPPKVKSGVIRMKRNDVTQLGCDEKLFRTIVKTTFGQRRKTLRNSIRGLLPPGCVLPDLQVWGQRPEQLSVQEFINLTNVVTALRGGVEK